MDLNYRNFSNKKIKDDERYIVIDIEKLIEIFLVPFIIK